jgi:hypothetical protein
MYEAILPLRRGAQLNNSTGTILTVPYSVPNPIAGIHGGQGILQSGWRAVPADTPLLQPRGK